MSELLHMLIARGDLVAIEGGRLIITPKSGNPVPTDWLKQHQPALLQQIAQTTGVSLCQYKDCRTGHYGQHNSGGITLHYVELSTGRECYTIFNAGLTRSRTTKSGKEGTRLPQGHFHPERAFLTYWQTLKLPAPRYPSEYHLSMHRLGSVLVTAQLDERGKMIKGSPALAHIEHGQLIATLEAITTGKPLGKSWEGYGKVMGKTTGKETAQSLTQQGLQANLSTGTEKHVKSKQESAGTSSSNYPISNSNIPVIGFTHHNVPPEQQTVEEWLADYESSPKDRRLA